METCGCQTWARDFTMYLTVHNPRCPTGEAAAELSRMVIRLLDGINKWASDEDGVPEDFFPTVEEAMQRTALRRGFERVGITPTPSSPASPDPDPAPRTAE